MKQIFLCFLISILVQYRACHPADTVSDMMSSMSKFANKTESSMESMTSSKNTTQTFTSSKSNLLLEAAKKLDITNFTSDEEFLRLLFESLFSIIKDTKSEEFLFFSDLTVIVPTIIDKIVKQLQAAFFNVFFGGIFNTGVTAADMGLKIATALENGKLSVASQGIETAQNVADTITSNVPSNGITDAVTKLVNTSLDDADGAIKAAKTLETAGSNAISNVLNKFKMANVSTNPVVIGSKIANAVKTATLTAASEGVGSTKKIADKIAGSIPSNAVLDGIKKIANVNTNPVAIGSKIANAVETAKLTAAAEGVESAKKVADKIAGSLPSTGVINVVKKIANASTNPVAIGSKIANAVETAKLTAASQGVESEKKIADNIAGSLPPNGLTDAVKKIEIADKIAGSLPSNGVTDVAKKIANASPNPVAIGSKIANAVETAKLPAASEGVESAKKIADQIAGSLPSNGVTDAVKKIASASTNPVAISSKIANAVETQIPAASEGVESAKKIADKIGGNLPSDAVTDKIKTIVSTIIDDTNGAVKAAKTLQTAGSNAIGGLFSSFKFG